MPDPIEKFQEFWRTLTRDEQGDLYFVLAAMRGPDFPAQGAPLKARYTKPIRRLLLGEDDGKIFSKIQAICPPTTPDHFLAHSMIAESVLRRHGFNKEEVAFADPRFQTGRWSKPNQQTAKGGLAVVPLPKISVGGSEVEVNVHLRVIPAESRRGA